MLLTPPVFAHPALLPDLLASGNRYWIGALLPDESPWFVVTYRLHASERPSQVHTAIVMWESALVDLVKTVTAEELVSVQRLARAARGWRVDAVVELLLPSDAEAPKTGPLLVRLEAGTLLDCYGARVDERPGRKVLAKLGEPS